MSEKLKLRAKIVLWVLVILTVGAIWALSITPAITSSEQSNVVTMTVVNPPSESASITQEAKGPSMTYMITLVRKMAHFAEFGVLGFLWALLGLFQWYPAMWLYGLGVALVDEGIQYFVPGRAAAVTDVTIDYCGFFCGFALVMVVARWLERKKSRNPRK